MIVTGLPINAKRQRQNSLASGKAAQNIITIHPLVGRLTGLAGLIRRGLPTGVRQQIDKQIAIAEHLKIRVLTLFDRSYPARLRTIPDPPPLLSVSGTLSVQDDVAVAIVGGRRATPSGRIVTEEIAKDLAGAGVTIVSGLARGIDAAAHRGALTGKGRTIAVLGCGIDRTYPPEHQELRRSIEAHGAVLSELPIGSSPLSHHFPRRNRIQRALVGRAGE